MTRTHKLATRRTPAKSWEQAPGADRHYCPNCPESFKTDEEYQDHWRNVHSVARVTKSRGEFQFPAKGGRW